MFLKKGSKCKKFTTGSDRSLKRKQSSAVSTSGEILGMTKNEEEASDLIQEGKRTAEAGAYDLNGKEEESARVGGDD